MSLLSHRDCPLKNILMHATHMYLLGFHPVEDLFVDDIKTVAPRISRLEGSQVLLRRLWHFIVLSARVAT